MNEVERERDVQRARLDPSAAAPAEARRFVGEVVDAPVVETVQLVVSELVTNAVRHGGAEAGPIDVIVHTRDGAVRLEVSQPRHAGFEAIVRHPGVDDATGRGLLIVDAVSSDWGVVPETRTVWATFA